MSKDDQDIQKSKCDLYPKTEVDITDIKRKSVSGGIATMVSQAFTIAIQLTSTVVLARLLSPDDYGVMAMVMAVTGFAGLFRDLGLSSAAIQKKDLTDAQQSNLFWLNVAMGAALTTIMAVGSPVVAWFYGKPELTSVTLALSLSFLIGSFGTQPGARLVREMQFARQGVASITGSVVCLIVSGTLALNEYSYWSLVWGGLVGSTVTTILLFMLAPFRPGLPSRGTGMRDMLKFGANVTAFSFVNYFHRNLDNILIGKFWGPAALGVYSRAYQLLMFPITAIRGPLNAVAFPAMSRLQSQPVDYRNYYRKITQLLAISSMPLTAFLFIASDPLIELLLGKTWSQVSTTFALLAITGFIQPVAGLRGTVLLSCGHGKRYLLWGVFNAVCVSLGFLIGVRWGVTGIATSYAIVNYAILYPSLILAFKDTPLSPKDFFMPILVPAAASIVAALFVYCLGRMGKLDAMHPVIHLVILSGVFATIYLLTSLVLPGGRHALVQVYRLLFPIQRRVS